jgi:hypothetical protein
MLGTYPGCTVGQKGGACVRVCQTHGVHPIHCLLRAGVPAKHANRTHTGPRCLDIHVRRIAQPGGVCMYSPPCKTHSANSGVPHREDFVGIAPPFCRVPTVCIRRTSQGGTYLTTPAVNEGRSRSLRISHTSRRAPLKPVLSSQLPCTPYHPPNVTGVYSPSTWPSLAASATSQGAHARTPPHQALSTPSGPILCLLRAGVPAKHANRTHTGPRLPSR